jgi:hypothetical protein
MCRSIKTLRGTTPASEDEIRAAALQFVRKVSGFRTPSTGNADAFDAAVSEIAQSSQKLLRRLPAKRVRPATAEEAHPPR